MFIRNLPKKMQTITSLFLLASLFFTAAFAGGCLDPCMLPEHCVPLWGPEICSHCGHIGDETTQGWCVLPDASTEDECDTIIEYWGDLTACATNPAHPNNVHCQKILTWFYGKCCPYYPAHCS